MNKKYYTANGGDVVTVRGSLGKVIGYGEGKTVIIEMLEGKDKCPHCEGILDTRWSALERSPLFQSSVKLVKKHE